MATTKEVQAVAELQCFGVTLFPDLLSSLAKTRSDSIPPSVPRGKYDYLSLGPTPERLQGLLLSDPLAPASFDVEKDLTGIDYLEDDGTGLDLAIKRDEAARERLDYAIRFFIEAEEKARGVIEGFLSR
jgi:transaldolase